MVLAGFDRFGGLTGSVVEYVRPQQPTIKKMAITDLSKGPPGSNGIPLEVWNLPALPPPKGKIPNFDHPENKDAQIIVMNSVFVAFMLLAVAVRFIIRQSQDKKIGWDGGM